MRILDVVVEHLHLLIHLRHTSEGVVSGLFSIENIAKLDVFDEWGQTPLSIANAVITVGIKDYYYQSSRVLRPTTIDLLLKLGATVRIA